MLEHLAPSGSCLGQKKIEVMVCFHPFFSKDGLRLVSQARPIPQERVWTVWSHTLEQLVFTEALKQS